MKLAISSIAWKPEDDDAVAEVMRRHGARAVELAPTAYWPDPVARTAGELAELRGAWERRGFPIVALQALLYGFPALGLFDDATRGPMRDRLVGMLDVAVGLGATALVFGSPRNRHRGARSWREALEVAVPFFAAVGAEAARRGVALCIEPNPPAYGCDFVTTAAEGRELVEAVGSPGFRLHLDAAGLLLAGDDPAAELERSLPWLGHVHLSAPELGRVHAGSRPAVGPLRQVLERGGYLGYTSIEMRAEPDRPARLAAVAAALDAVAGAE